MAVYMVEAIRQLAHPVRPAKRKAVPEAAAPGAGHAIYAVFAFVKHDLAVQPGALTPLIGIIAKVPLGVKERARL